MILSIVGATGMVGSVILKVLKEQNIKYDELILVASEKSINKELTLNGESYKLISIEEAIKRKADYAIFSAGSEVSIKYARKFNEVGTTVIDNSSAWRMDNKVPLIVPEINADTIGKSKLIANPNCTTIQTVLSIHKLHQRYKIKRLVLSTYQSVSGSGYNGVSQLENERKNLEFKAISYPHPIDKNIIPHGGNFTENGYTDEEIKLVNETTKILNDTSIAITATVARVPVTGGHSVAVNIEFENNFDLKDVREELNNTEGLKVLDDPMNNIYPMPILSENKDDVYVGRIRRDFSINNGLNMWICADNLRKGAATNTVQILKYLLKHNTIY